MLRPAVIAAAAGLALGLSACTPAEVSVWVARSTLHTTPPEASGGFWCARYVDTVETDAHTPGWVSESGPGQLYADHADRLSQIPHVGDLVFVDLMGGTMPGAPISHVGIVEAPLGDGRVLTIEGNADPSNTVTEHVRATGDGYVVAYAQP